MARDKFFLSLRNALGFLAPEVKTDSQTLNSTDIQRQIQDAAIWLTPKSVEGFDAKDFLDLPKAQRTALSNEVAEFTKIAEQVPADGPATDEQIQNAHALVYQGSVTCQ